jgi:glyoxylase I family protein
MLYAKRRNSGAGEEGLLMDTIERTQQTPADLLGELPLRLHHNAYPVKDHEANRHFLEDVLGIPLVATWCEKTYRADLGREVEFCHTFFGLKDGGALAFFQFADDELYQLTQAKAPAQVGSFHHIALKASDQTYEELKQRLHAAGEKFRETDHGYCKSIYTATPDGMLLEFTCDPPNVGEIDKVRKADAHSELQRWLGGDRRVNNDLRHP